MTTMDWINKKNVLIVGLGLMGGSYAKALKRLGYHMMAIDKNFSSIDYALDNGIIDEGYDYINEECVSSADTIIFAIYPGAFKQWIIDNQHLFKENIRITDVTGVKSCIVYDIQSVLRDDVEFIASHPMAGRETSGVKNANTEMFRDANFIITPTEKNTDGAIEWCENLGAILGFGHIAVLTPEEHDKMIGFVSQLTHCIAVSLMTCSDNEHLVDYTGDSFRDLTRIAKINDIMWSELFMLNKESLLNEMDAFINEFTAFRDMLASDDVQGMRSKMRLSTKRRALFDKKK